jgi:hypothetical protein
MHTTSTVIAIDHRVRRTRYPIIVEAPLQQILDALTKSFRAEEDDTVSFDPSDASPVESYVRVEEDRITIIIYPTAGRRKAKQYLATIAGDGPITICGLSARRAGQ